jgi:hypothetical protein
MNIEMSEVNLNHIDYDDKLKFLHNIYCNDDTLFYHHTQIGNYIPNNDNFNYLDAVYSTAELNGDYFYIDIKSELNDNIFCKNFYIDKNLDIKTAELLVDNQIYDKIDYDLYDLHIKEFCPTKNKYRTLFGNTKLVPFHHLISGIIISNNSTDSRIRIKFYLNENFKGILSYNYDLYKYTPYVQSKLNSYVNDIPCVEMLFYSYRKYDNCLNINNRYEISSSIPINIIVVKHTTEDCMKLINIDILIENEFTFNLKRSYLLSSKNKDILYSVYKTNYFIKFPLWRTYILNEKNAYIQNIMFYGCNCSCHMEGIYGITIPN